MSGPRELDPAGVDLAGLVRPGDGVLFGQACGEPVPLVDALLEQAPALGVERVFAGLTFRDLPVPPSVRVVSYGALGRLGRLPAEQLDVVPCAYSAIPRLLEAGMLPGDVVLLTVSPPDVDGRCSLGVVADYVADALAGARTVIAEVSDRCPRTRGPSVAWSDLDAVLVTSRPLLDAPAVPARGPEEQIAAHVAELVRDGDTLQLGVGGLPEAILRALSGHRDLGIHTGMITEGMLDLMAAGAVTNARKARDTGVTVTATAFGTSERLRAELHERDDVRFAAVSETHAASVLAHVGPLAAINSVLELDLTGQAGAESVGPRRLGAVGGQGDFLRAAAAGGGRGIVALPAQRIVRSLSGPVSPARPDVDWVVTEHGARSLAGLGEKARTAALLDLAGVGAPDELSR